MDLSSGWFLSLIIAIEPFIEDDVKLPSSFHADTYDEPKLPDATIPLERALANSRVAGLADAGYKRVRQCPF